MSTLQTIEDVAEEVASRLAAVTVAQGGETDLGLSVLRGRIHVDDTMLPCVSVIETGDSPEHRGNAARVVTTADFVIFAYLACDPMHPNLAAHKALRDLKRAIFRTGGQPSRDWGRKVQDVKYRGYEIGARSDGAAFVAVGLKVAVDFVEDLANP